MNYSDNYILLSNHRNWDNRVVFSKETRLPPNLLNLKSLGGHLYSTAQCKQGLQENMLIGMEFSFSSLAVVSGWPFVVVKIFFPASSPNSFWVFTQPLQTHSSTQAMFTWGWQAENSCWVPRDGTLAHKFNTAAVMKVRYYLRCPLLKLHIKHPKDLGYVRDAVWFFSALSFFLFFFF